MELFKLFGTIAINAQEAINDLGRVTTAAAGAGREIGDGVDTGAGRATGGIAGFASKGLALFGQVGLAVQGASAIISG
ncbi:hypothetical protein GM525_13405, partial [Streptococcus pneumoniae]|uniref:hypothetical protein n=1 Tax=Streptococcus pneumoniae TaxID=1313 RepID=UPI0012D76414